MVEEQPVEKPYSLNKFRIPKKKSIDSSDTESDKQVDNKTEVAEKSKKAVVEESKQPLTASKIQPKKTSVETPPSKPVHRLSISKESIDGSDSEPELKIAEESDHEEDNNQRPETDKEQTGSSEKSVKSTSGDTTAKDENERGQLTKAMLQNIVASIG